MRLEIEPQTLGLGIEYLSCALSLALVPYALCLLGYWVLDIGHSSCLNCHFCLNFGIPFKIKSLIILWLKLY
jgi:hypothetical protein